MESSLVLFWKSLRDRGLIETARAVFALLRDILFDMRHGTDTQAWVSLDNLSVDEKSRNLGNHYQSVGVLRVQETIGLVPLPPEKINLVDFGSGKGLPLLLAIQLGLKSATGVEFAEELCATARKNLAIFKAKFPAAPTAVTIVRQDASLYEIQPDENVFLFCNPFGQPILRAVLENIEKSRLANPRPIWILYIHPVHAEEFDSNPRYVKVNDSLIWGYRLLIYENQPA